MSDPVLILLLLIIGPASICITTILGYLAFLHITKRYATQASNNVFDRLFDLLERRLPDIVESLVLPKRDSPTSIPDIKTEDLGKKLAEGKELLTKLFGSLGVTVEDDTSPLIDMGNPSLKQRRHRTIDVD